MLAGEAPYAGPSPHSILAKRLVDPVPSVRRLRGTVPPEVDRAVSRALARAPADRFPSVGDFGAVLARAMATPAGGTATAERALAPSVAVLPFRNLSADPENEYFADGITEDVIAHLSKIRALRVISRGSVMQFKQRAASMRDIGATLGAATLLDGSVRRAGNRVRIVAQLVDGDSDRQMWAETYDRQLTDIFEIQTDVALHIASALRAELSHDEQVRVERRPTDDLQAYQLYLQGRQWMSKYTKEGHSRAIDLYRRALDRDPSFGLAAANASLSYIELAEQGFMPPDDAFARAATYAELALRDSPELSAAHMSAGYLRASRDFDFIGAEAEYRHALELSPNDAEACDLLGRLYAGIGRYDDALQMLRRAQELDPLAHQNDIITTLLRAGRYEEAAERAATAVEINTTNPRTRATLAWAEFLRGRTREGLAAMEHAVSLAPGSTLWLGQLGEMYAMAGDVERARSIARDLQERARTSFVSPYHLAYVYTGLGEHDRAIDLLEHAIASRTGATYGIKGSFLFIPLRTHPRWKALLATMNLEP
jgi:serine/threonine-protein kinase